MLKVTDLVLIATAAYLVYALTRRWLARADEARRARLHGCQLPRQVPQRDPLFGLDVFIAMIKAHVAGHRSDFISRLHRAHGATFEINALTRTIRTAHAENIKAICTSSFEDFGVEPVRGALSKPFIDRGVFTHDGPFWRYSRAMIKPTFARTEIADLSNFERHVTRFLDHIPPDGTTFDLTPLVKSLFLDSATEFLFGRSTDSQLPDAAPAAAEFNKAYDRAMLGLGLIMITGPLRYPLYWDPGWRKAYKKVHAFVDAHVERALERRRQQDQGKEAMTEGRYVLLEELTAHTQDPYLLRMQLINIFSPARDTVGIAFSHCIFELARHPEEWQKLRNEVLELQDAPLTYERLRLLPHVRALISETLRVHPTLAGSGRVCLRDTILPRGGGIDGLVPLFVSKGTAIEMDIYSLQHDPNIWGDDADRFRPSRWTTGRPLWESRWEYEPFLGGIRMCPARNQVLTQLAYLLVRVAQHFETLENRDPHVKYYEKVTVASESRNGAQVALWRIKSG